MTVAEYIKGLISDTVAYKPGEKVPADAFNNILNKIITQGNNNAEGTEAACKAVTDFSAGSITDGSVTTEKLADAAITSAKLNDSVFEKLISHEQYLNLISFVAQEQYTKLAPDTTQNYHNLFLKKGVTVGQKTRILIGALDSPECPQYNSVTYTTLNDVYPHVYDGSNSRIANHVKGNPSDIKTIEVTWEPTDVFAEMDTLNTDATIKLSLVAGRSPAAAIIETDPVVNRSVGYLPQSQAVLTIYFSDGRQIALNTFSTPYSTISPTSVDVTLNKFNLVEGTTISKLVLKITLPTDAPLKVGYCYYLKPELTFTLATSTTAPAFTSESIFINPASYAFGVAVETGALDPPAVSLITSTQKLPFLYYETMDLGSTGLHFFKGGSPSAVSSGVLEITPAHVEESLCGYWFIG